MRAIVILAGVVMLAACSGGQDGGDKGAAADGSPAVDSTAATGSLFETQIQPILSSNCATCHLTGQEAGNMSLIPGKAIGSLVDIAAAGAPALKRVVPGNPDASYLIHKLEGTQVEHGGTGAQMPFGAPPLPPEKIALFRKWIAEGAKP